MTGEFSCQNETKVNGQPYLCCKYEMDPEKDYSIGSEVFKCVCRYARYCAVKNKWYMGDNTKCENKNEKC